MKGFIAVGPLVVCGQPAVSCGLFGLFRGWFLPFWPFDFNFDVFGFRNWGHLGILVGLSPDLLRLFSYSWSGGEAGLLV